MLFDDAATVEQANAALAAANVTVVGTVPGLNLAVTAVSPEPAPGDFGPVMNALATLRAAPGVSSALLDQEEGGAALPPQPDAVRQARPGGGTSRICGLVLGPIGARVSRLVRNPGTGRPVIFLQRRFHKKSQA